MVEGINDSLSDNRCEVIVCTGEVVFTGIFQFNFEQRLIDALNEGVRVSPQVKMTDFVKLQDAFMTGIDHDRKHFPVIYIAKHNVIFVAQVTSKKREKPLTTYPFRPKTSTDVTIFAAQIYMAQSNVKPIRLRGEIYVDSWGQLVDTLEGSPQFVPLTSVTIEQAPPHVGNRYAFMAINKQRIISICENRERQ